MGGDAFDHVHDIAAIPKEGLNYAVYQPVDLTPIASPVRGR